MRITYLIIFILNSFLLISQNDWVFTSGSGYSYARNLEYDDNGNIYFTGNGADLEINNQTIGSTNNVHSFIGKMDSEGNTLWINDWPAQSSPAGFIADLDVSGDGTSYLLLRFTNGTTINNQTWEYIDNQYFLIAKLDADGGFLWTQIVPSSHQGSGRLSSDDEGNVYVTLYNTINKMYFGKFDSLDGALLWDYDVYTYGSGNSDSGAYTQDMDCDGEGNCYFTGAFTWRLEFPDTTYLANSVSKDFFVLKLNSEGEREWIRIEGSDEVFTGGSSDEYNEGGLSLTLLDDELYIFGVDRLDSLENYNLSIGNGYYGKMDANTGDFTWMKSIGDIYLQGGKASSMTIDENYNFYFLIDWAPTTRLVLPEIELNILDEYEYGSAVVKLDGEGNFIYMRPLFPSGNASDLFIKDGRVHVCGRVSDKVYTGNGVIFSDGNFYMHFYDEADYSITIDSMYSSGICFTDSIGMLTSTSANFFAENDFYVEVFSNYPDNITPSPLVELSPFYAEGYIDIDSLKIRGSMFYSETTYVRLCSSLPAVCSDYYWMGNDQIDVIDDLTCEGDTLVFTIDNRLEDIQWTSTNGIFEMVTTDTFQYVISSTDQVNLSAVHPFGCVVADSFLFEVPQILDPFLEDTVNIACNNPGDSIHVSINTDPNVFGYSYSWFSPSFFSYISFDKVALYPPEDIDYPLTTIHPSGCKRQDTLSVKQSGCRVLQGELSPFVQSSVSLDQSTVSLLTLDSSNQTFQVIKSFELADGSSSFSFRTSDSLVYLYAQPSTADNVYNQFFPTYYEMNPLGSNATEIQVHQDTTNIDFQALGYNEYNSSIDYFSIEGYLLDYYTLEPLAFRNLYLVDTTTEFNGSVDNSQVLRFDKTASDGSFFFTALDNGIYELLLDSLTFDFESVPYFDLNTSNAEELLFVYLKNDTLLSCNALDPLPNCTTISGQIKLDQEGDCDFDGNESPSINHIVEVNPGQFYLTTDSLGVFSAVISSGTYSIQASEYQYPYTVETCTENLGYNLTLIDSTYNDLNFGYQFIPGMNDLAIYGNLLTNRIRPGNIFTYQIDYKNWGTTQQDAVLSLAYSIGDFELLEASIPPSQVYNDSIVWNLESLGPLDEGCIVLSFDVDPNPDLIGQVAFFRNTIFPIAEDETPIDNIDTFSLEIFGPYDPNDKAVVPAGDGPDGYIYFEDVGQFEYKIRFQNVGNDTAFNVVIVDTIDQKLNPASIKVLAASHPFQLDVSEQGTTKFIFNNIQLVDSTTNEVESHGFVRFEIDPFMDYQIGDVITNKADIYFDFNPPIRTNEVKNTIVEFVPNNTTESYVDFNPVFISPNPVRDNLSINVVNSITLQQALLSIYDYKGRKIYDQSISTLPAQINLSQLEKGAYIVSIITNKGILIQEKFIKL